MKKSKQARAREFSARARKEIRERDGDACIFCRMGYCMEGASWYSLQIRETMHYVPRSRGGLGIPENGALGCRWHHEMMDNGNRGKREEMLELFKGYLKGKYPDWDEKELTYSGW